MSSKPVAAGKSSFDLVDHELVFSHMIAKEDATYLDLACGAGRYTLALAEQLGTGSTIHAFDLWPEGVAAMMNDARERGLSAIKGAVADVTRPLPLPEETVDVCFIATALHDLPAETRDSVIDEIRRVLVPGGTMLLIEFKKLDHGPGPGKEKRISEEDADALILPHGFRKAEAVSLGEYTYLVRYVAA